MSLTPVTKRGLERLATYERTIQDGLKTFKDVGDALIAIRDEQLYRDDYGDFDSYCLRRWGFTAGRARQLMVAAGIATVVAVLNEAQARALVPFRDDEPRMVEAWDLACSRGEPTAEKLAKAVAEIQKRDAAPAIEPPKETNGQASTQPRAPRRDAGGSAATEAAQHENGPQDPQSEEEESGLAAPSGSSEPARPGAAAPHVDPDASMSVPVSEGPNAAPIDTTARETHVHRCECGVEWHENANPYNPKRAVAS